MLKLNASYSKKIPAEQDFSSKSYHCCIETEIPDGISQDDLQRRIHDTFSMVRHAVEDELRQSAAPTTHAPATVPAAPAPAARPDSGETRKASNKQIKYLLDLANREGRDIRWINAEILRRFQAQSVYDLCKKDASALIDDLCANRRAA